MKTSQMSFNLDQLTAWYMIGHLEKNIKATIFIAESFCYFWTSHFVKFQSKCFFLNCANCISQEGTFLQKFFLWGTHFVGKIYRGIVLHGRTNDQIIPRGKEFHKMHFPVI